MVHGVWLVPVIFFLLLCSSGISMALRPRLRDKHRASDTVDHVRLVVSILVTLTALVLGLVLTNVKGSFDSFDSRLRAFAGDLSDLDIHLLEYGDGAKPIRVLLREYVAAAIADSWRDEPPPSGAYPRFSPSSGIERRELGVLLVKIDMSIHELDPPDGFHQRLAQSMSNQMDEALAARRSVIETAHDTITWPLMVAICAWLAVVFGVFGLLAPRNAVVHLTIVICALCVASAIFLIVDFDSPFDGLLHVSSEPLRDTLSHIDMSAEAPL
jgi:Protein of unknown function (DUF4239)